MSNNGKTPIPTGKYLEATRQSHGPSTLRASVATIVANRAPRNEGSVKVVAPPVVNVQVAGPNGLPPGFGTQVNWAGEEDLAILAFINTRDEYGLCVTGVRDGDIYENVAALGTASFATSNNNWVTGLITAVAAGLNAAASAFNQPELAPLINAAATYARQQFPESNHPSMQRDPYGVDPNGGRARAEGGAILCEPTAQGVYHSGDSDHEDRWIQGNGVRNDANMPRHIPAGQAFFLQQGMAPHRLNGNGDLLIAAWDWNFPDNSGYYLIHAILKRGRQAHA